MPDSPPHTLLPPKQHNLQMAVDLVVKVLADQSEPQLRWLGAEPDGRHWHLTALGEPLNVDLRDGQVLGADGQPVRPPWRVLVLHYLGTTVRPAGFPPSVTFADLPGGRGYAGVYRQRVNGRLCATAGRDREALRRAATALGARFTTGGDLAFDLQVFPRLPVRVVWYAGDDEFPPDAAVLLPPNVNSLLCTEDIVVVSERVVAALSEQRLAKATTGATGPSASPAVEPRT